MVRKLLVPAFLPPLSTIPRTIATTTSATTPPAMASARGDAWRARTPPAPFERTGGGVRTAVAAACLCCLALLPLGMRGKGSGRLGLSGGCEDQESDEKEEGCEREGRDREVAERVVGDPVDAAAAEHPDGARL